MLTSTAWKLAPVQPIVLHRDAVSAGGYAMVATVISSDMDTVAQLAPGSTAVFES